MKSFVNLNGWRDAGLSLIYPCACQLCGASVESFADGSVCAACWSKTLIFNSSQTLCQKCGRPLRHAGKLDAKAFCHRCDHDFYQNARAVGVYEGALRLVVLELKEKPFVPPRLGDLLVQAFQQAPVHQATKIIPVPLHPKRLRERGFNQAALIAQNLSRHVNLPVVETCLAREIYTKQHRTAMDERSRRESVEKAFIVKQPRLIQNQQILLVDDVFTSGATASVCAKTLKENGASDVFVLTIARTV